MRQQFNRVTTSHCFKNLKVSYKEYRRYRKIYSILLGFVDRGQMFFCLTSLKSQSADHDFEVLKNQIWFAQSIRLAGAHRRCALAIARSHDHDRRTYWISFKSGDYLQKTGQTAELKAVSKCRTCNYKICMLVALIAITVWATTLQNANKTDLIVASPVLWTRFI